MNGERFPFSPDIRLCAAALAGDEEALQQLASSPELQPLIISNRIAPGLAIRAVELDITGGQICLWNQHMRAAAGSRLQLEAARRNLADAFASDNIPWAPLKGMGLDPRLYPHPEERISTDIDVLVAPNLLEAAVCCLTRYGWTSLTTTRRQQQYVLDEGYNWKLKLGEVILELHFRLWGGVPEEFAAAVLGTAASAPDIGETALQIALTDAYVIAAVHVWQTPTPRYLMLWWDLHRMATIMDSHRIREVIRRSINYDLQAFINLTSATAADLWGHQTNRQIADELATHLRPAERWAARRLEDQSPATCSFQILTLGRLLANRKSRSGWRAVPRQIWAHPGTVESDTPDTRSWPIRRLIHVARKLHLTKK